MAARKSPPARPSPSKPEDRLDPYRARRKAGATPELPSLDPADKRMAVGLLGKPVQALLGILVVALGLPVYEGLRRAGILRPEAA